MKSKTLIILLAIACTLSLFAIFISSRSKPEKKQSALGQKLFDSLPVNEIAAITISSPEDTVLLEKGKSVWIVKNRFNYPADFAMIADLIKKIKGIKIGRSFEASAETISRLALHPPDQSEVDQDHQGTHIVIENRERNILTDIILGKAREVTSGTGGHYIKSTKTSKVYLVDRDFKFLNTKPSEWLDKDLMDIESENIAKVTCFAPMFKKTIYTLKRPAKGKDPELMQLPQRKKIIPFKVENVFEALSPLRIEDIVDPSHTDSLAGFDETPCFEYCLFNGTCYKVYPGSSLKNDKDKFYFKATVRYSPAKDLTGKEASSKGKQKESGKGSSDQIAAKVERINQKLISWIYIISKWKHESFVADPEEFFEKEQSDSSKSFKE
jgi:hypothetical protein